MIKNLCVACGHPDNLHVVDFTDAHPRCGVGLVFAGGEICGCGGLLLSEPRIGKDPWSLFDQEAPSV